MPRHSSTNNSWRHRPSALLLPALAGAVTAGAVSLVPSVARASPADYRQGFGVGRQQGYKDGYSDGYKETYKASYYEGLKDGSRYYSSGIYDYRRGYTAGYRIGYTTGYERGKGAGGRDGYTDGFSDGGSLRLNCASRCATAPPKGLVEAHSGPSEGVGAPHGRLTSPAV